MRLRAALIELQKTTLTRPQTCRSKKRVFFDDNQGTCKVWINENQYFGNVSKLAWEFYIGGYQPAEKWMNDRRDCELSFEEIQHYQKIIVALVETDRLMKEIDEIDFL